MCPACTPNVLRLPPHVPLQVVLRFRREADESDDAPRSSPLFHVFSTEYKVPCTALPTSTQPQPGPNPAPTRVWTLAARTSPPTLVRRRSGSTRGCCGRGGCSLARTCSTSGVPTRPLGSWSTTMAADTTRLRRRRATPPPSLVPLRRRGTQSGRPLRRRRRRRWVWGRGRVQRHPRLSPPTPPLPLHTVSQAARRARAGRPRGRSGHRRARGPADIRTAPGMPTAAAARLSRPLDTPTLTPTPMSTSAAHASSLPRAGCAIGSAASDVAARAQA